MPPVSVLQNSSWKLVSTLLASQWAFPSPVRLGGVIVARAVASAHVCFDIMKSYESGFIDAAQG